jgi:hypothetical protein
MENIEELKEAHNQYLKLYRQEHKDNMKLSYKKWYDKIKDSEEFKQKSRENSKKQYQKKIAEKQKKEYKLSEEERAKHRMYYQKRKIQSQNITTN